VRLDKPVDVLRSEPLGIVHVELSALLALGLFPVDLLAPRLDDVEIEVGIVIPDEGELRVSDLDGDPPDDLAPLAKPGQTKAISPTGSRVVVGNAASAAWLPATGQRWSRLEPRQVHFHERVSHGLLGSPG